jgi:K+-transporting ATPase ATPase C chain
MKTLFTALKIFLLLTVVTGILYPLFITGIAQLVFPEKANGSLIVKGDITIGSKLIGQQFDSTIYFTSRPSAVLYNPLPSGGSNYGLTSIKLRNLFTERKNQFLAFNQLDSTTEIPSEMLFSSASGVDPHISPKAAMLQFERVAKARNFSIGKREELLRSLKELSEPPQFLFLGEDRINVLILNLELNKLDMNYKINN